jgi:hypothetical protein
MHVYLRFPTRAMRLNTTALVNTYARISTFSYAFSYKSNDATVCACCHLFYVCTCEYLTLVKNRYNTLTPQKEILFFQDSSLLESLS